MAHTPRLLLFASLAVSAAVTSSCSSPSKPQAVDAPVRIRWARDPESFDPFMQPNQNAVEAQGLLNGGLLAVNPETRRYEPFLAEALPTVSYSGDSLTLLSYRLKPAAAWGSGKPITAADVAFTLKLIFCKGVPNEGFQLQEAFIRDIKSDPRDARRFTLVCKGKAPDYVQASGDFPVLQEAALDPEGRMRKYSVAEFQGRANASRRPELAQVQQLIAARYTAASPAQHPQQLGGSGPYSLKEWNRDRQVIFTRKKNWWGDKAGSSILFQAKASQLEYVIIPEESSAALALRSGQLDVFPNVPARVFERLKNSATAQQKLAFYTSPTYEVMTAGFNTSRPALHDAATRQALSRLFDAEQLRKASQLGKGFRTVGIISPQEKGKYNDSLALLPYSPSAAAELLTKAGWRRGPAGWNRQSGKSPAQHLHLQLRYRAGDTNYELVALQFASAAKALGIPVALAPTESGVLRGLLQTGDFDMYVQSIKGNPFLFNFLPILGTPAIGESNLTRFASPAADQLMLKIAAAESSTERDLLLRRFQTLMQQQMPLVPLYFVANRVIASKAVAGVNVMSLKPGYVASTIYHVAPAR
ncbi:ABC transporter substrate-binding protein [Hymenobacter negativus]|uniref:ABC transporter substrate-binding protein n=1 Tax=Hymenobacter negativus TaxID=2795026 RepID=A0ABS0Q8E1_9BACT|nr:ABC transporter substrate-binding protein [Hymenobacter negativus]MBH8558952.1 ABC transporter substrate-binding protein [Hymenobacter negativus]